MSKQRTNNTVVAQGTKQQVSKILMGQMLTWAKRYTNLSCTPYSYKASQVESSAITKIMRSGYGRDGAITSWTSDDFDFRFEYGRRGGVRVSYMNNQGLQSAIFQKDEWLCMMNYIDRKIHGLLNAEKAKEEEEQRKAEEEKFQKAVEAAILSDITKGDASRIRHALAIEDACHGKLKYGSAAEAHATESNAILKARTGHDAAHYARKIKETLKERIDSEPSISLDDEADGNASEEDFVEA